MFNKGDIVYHKATGKRCVILTVEGDTVIVRTQDDEKRRYENGELEPEQK